jgi:hypothetical protein
MNHIYVKQSKNCKLIRNSVQNHVNDVTKFIDSFSKIHFATDVFQFLTESEIMKFFYPKYSSFLFTMVKFRNKID